MSTPLQQQQQQLVDGWWVWKITPKKWKDPSLFFYPLFLLGIVETPPPFRHRRCGTDKSFVSFRLLLIAFQQRLYNFPSEWKNGRVKENERKKCSFKCCRVGGIESVPDNIVVITEKRKWWWRRRVVQFNMFFFQFSRSWWNIHKRPRTFLKFMFWLPVLLNVFFDCTVSLDVFISFCLFLFSFSLLICPICWRSMTPWQRTRHVSVWR
jgi:hypothetical protein